MQPQQSKLVAWASPLDQRSQSGQLALRAASLLDAEVYILPLDDHRPPGCPPLVPDAWIRGNHDEADRIHWIYSLTAEPRDAFLRAMQLGQSQPGLVVSHGEPSGPCITRFLLTARGLERRYERLFAAAGYSAWLSARIQGRYGGSIVDQYLLYAELQSIATGLIFVGSVPQAVLPFFPADWIANVEAADATGVAIDVIAEGLAHQITSQLNTSLIRSEWTLAAKSIGTSLATVGAPCSTGTLNSIAESIKRLSKGLV